MAPSQETKALAYLARYKKISRPRTPNSMLTPDRSGQGVVKKKTFDSVLPLAASQPNIEVGGCGGGLNFSKTHLHAASVFFFREGNSYDLL